MPESNPPLALVTGASGMVGSHLVRRLLDEGWRVRALMRPTSDTALLKSWGVELAQGDLGDPAAALADAVKGAEYVFHCAAMVSDWVLPEYATAVPMVAEAYAFAVEHPEVVSYLPCACGCEAMGHNSNWNCYVQSVTSSGEVVFDTHAQGCNVCIDITLDGKRMWQRGSPLSEIRQYIDEHYDATMQTELPPAA